MKNINLSTKLIIASLSYQRLDYNALDNLDSAFLDNSKKAIEFFKKDLGFKLDSICILKKCNAVIILISYQEDLSLEFIKNRILLTWEEKSKNGISNFSRDIKFFKDIEALRFLGELIAGLHSVTIGDSQVVSQVIDGINKALIIEGNVFKVIIQWLREIKQVVEQKTNIFKGNISLERIAASLIKDNLSLSKEILILGYGRSGKLVGKILADEFGYPLIILNRTEVKNDQLKNRSKKPNLYPKSLEEVNFKKIACVVVALDNNDETEKLINTLITKIDLNSKVYFIDLSTPSLLKNKLSNIIDIKILSEISHSTLNKREAEISKAKNIINENIPLLVEAINKEIMKSYIGSQNTNFNKIEKDKLNLMIYRNEVYKSIRKLMEKEDYVEVTTPYIVGISTDPPKVDSGGTINVEWQNDMSAFLRQSNQMYKQILVASGMKKIYEIGPFWRKEPYESYRHLQESIGLDIEISKPKSLSNLYLFACEIIKNTNAEVRKKNKIKNNLLLPAINKIPVLTYTQAVDILRSNGSPISLGDDLGLVGESRLGQIIYRDFKSSIFVVKDYPDTIKKFYTKNKKNGLTETFDVILDGWEIVSGAIRQTDGSVIRKSMSLSGIASKNYSFYISIIDKSPEHGGFCIGLDRLIAKILGKEMVSDAVLFPRTYKKLIP